MYNFVFEKELFSKIHGNKKERGLIDFSSVIRRGSKQIGTIKAIYFDSNCCWVDEELYEEYLEQIHPDLRKYIEEENIDMDDNGDFMDYYQDKFFSMYSVEDIEFDFEFPLEDFYDIYPEKSVLIIVNIDKGYFNNLEAIERDFKYTIETMFGCKDYVTMNLLKDYTEEISIVSKLYTDDLFQVLKRVVDVYGDDLEKTIKEMTLHLESYNYKCIDKRDKGGAFWIIGGDELKPLVWIFKDLDIELKFTSRGGLASKFKAAWYFK